jgi:bla regulator protein blaR1
MINAFDYLPVFFAVFWKSGVVLGAALGLSLLLRRRSADLRRLVLSTAVVAMFVAAAALPMLPRWILVTPLSAPRAVSERASASAIVDDTELTATDNQSTAVQPAARRIDLSPWLIPLIWFAGAATLLARFAINLLGLHRLRKASEAMTDADLPRRVRLWRSEAIGAPVTWGVVRPIILVPAGFGQLPAECRDAVLCHELAHIQAHDFLIRGLAEIARALIWFQPLMWIVWRQLREEQELACDNRVLATGRKPSAYAKLLLDWESSPGLDSLIAVGIANRSCLKRRLYALLDPDLRRDTVARAGIAGAWLLGLAIALPLAAISITQAIPAQPASARVVQLAPKPPVQMAQAQSPPAPVKPPSAQPAAAPKPKFDVASIKPCQPGDGPGRGGNGDMGANRGVDPTMPEGIGGYFRASPGRLDITCGSILTMVSFAYIGHGSPLLNNPGGPMREAEGIQGVPKWALAARYTIHAETDDPVANGQTQRAPGERGAPLPAASLLYGPMLQGLLEERFQLKIHREMAQVPMYALTVAKSGLKPKPIQPEDCTQLEPGQGMRMIGADDKPYCGWVGWPAHGPNRTLVGGGITLDRLARELGALVLDRNVMDHTGIAGIYNIRLEYAPDENTRCMGPASMCAVDPNSDIPPGPTIFTALEQQLGLKLEPIKGPREHIVVDSVERPSEN